MSRWASTGARRPTGLTNASLRALALAARRATTDPAKRAGLAVQAYALEGRARPYGRREREDPRIRTDRLRVQASKQPRDERGRWVVDVLRMR